MESVFQSNGSFARKPVPVGLNPSANMTKLGTQRVRGGPIQSSNYVYVVFRPAGRKTTYMKK